MKIILKKSDNYDDWYTIEKAEHKNEEFFEVDENDEDIQHYRYSGRITDACVEGTAEEMLSIANAIISRGFARHKRCAVRIINGKAYFESPRNSQHEVEITLKDADEFADQVLKTLSHQKENAQ